MKTKVYFIITSVLILSFVLGLQQSCTKKDETPSNSAPVIQNITSSPNTSSNNRLPVGEQVTISVTATDPDKDNLSYTWEAQGGNFTGQTDQSSVTWKSPLSTSLEDYEITATVSDGAKTVTESIDIYVDKATPGINATPKTFDFGTEITQMQVKIFNIGEGQLNWTTYNENTPWLDINPKSGTIDSPNDTSYVTLTVIRDGLNPESYSKSLRFVNNDDNTNYVSINVSMEVAETSNLEGYVYYSSTTIPVSGVLVSVGESNSTTGSDGHYEFTDVLTGNQTITATKDGYDSYSTNIQVVSGNNEYNIEMTSALYTHNLYGIITDKLTGSPISYVNVVILNPDGTESNLKTQTSSSGYYQIPTVPQGERTVIFSHNEYEDGEINVFMANSDYELNLEMNTCYAVVSTGNYEMIYALVFEVDGEITSLGCSDVIQHGHCWSTNPNPTIESEKTELGSTNNLGSYTSEVKYLYTNTNYHVRAYITNSYGTYYGEEITFTTPNSTDCGTIYYDGQTYETIIIGNQCWMKENLNYRDEPYWVCYDNNSDNCDIYGLLYNYEWGNSNEVPSGVKGPCPDGWHIPSYSEWLNLSNNLGGADIAGGKLKEEGTLHWASPNTGATNESGFTALPGGLWSSYTHDFMNLTTTAWFWSTTEDSSSDFVKYIKLSSSSIGFNIQSAPKSCKMSIRCVRD